MPDAPSGSRHKRITICIPMLNEEAHIAPCLASVTASRLSAGREIEVLVLDGGSTDRSCEIVKRVQATDKRIRLLHNPARLQAAAINQALGVATGTALARVDAHAALEPDYLENALLVLERTGAVNAGGAIIPQGTSRLGLAIAAAYTSAFGLGHARHDPSATEQDVDTVSFGVFDIKAVKSVGGMDSSLAVNEDFELNIRLRRAGGRVIWSPNIRSCYVVRGSFPKLARQYFRYGFWKVRTLRMHPGSLRWRQLVAPAFVASVLLTPLTVWWLGAWGTAHLAAYIAANLAASVATARAAGWRHLPLLPLVFAIIHLAWGSGFWAGWAYWPLRGRDAG